MRLTYAISFEDFKSLQPTFTVRPGKNVGFKGVLVACSLIGLLGVFCMAEGFGWQVGVFLVALGAIAAVAAYYYEKRSVRSGQQRYEESLATGYQRLHCRDRRLFETDENGFSASCSCGTVTRPWSELTQFSETEKHVALATKSGGQIVPKSAFPSQATITEFRALITEKVNYEKPATARHVDFMCTHEDFRRARILHMLRAGGWRQLLRVVATYACAAYGFVVIWKATHKPAIIAALIGGVAAPLLLRLAKQRPKARLVPLRIYFDEQGLYLQDPTTQARTTWPQFVGYLENSKILLLYYNPRLYRIIPKRALAGQGAELAHVIKAKLVPYNYRKPALKVQMQAPGAVQQTS